MDLVLAVGDLADNGSVASLQTRLAANAGTLSGITGLATIPFYAVRGNHDDNSTAQTFFQGNLIPAGRSGVTVNLAPDNTSYAVNHKGTTFVLLDILATKGNDGPYFGWMRLQLSNTGSTGLIRDWAYDNTGGSITVGAVPEPSASALAILLGSAALCLRRRK